MDHNTLAAAIGAEPAPALRALRAAGPDGMEAFIRAFGDRLNDPDISARLDAIAGQRHARTSRMFWYTDLDRAIRAARKANRPILSLRLLGRLDEAQSCANSRFFRHSLYPDHAVSRLMRAGFVLHWQSVRPVPKINIDFGDGRMVSYPLTGNSTHLILDRSGAPIDAIPGLYTPEEFAAHLRRVSALGAAPRRRKLLHYHYECMMAAARPPRVRRARRSDPPDAREAGMLTMSKAMVEMPVIEAILPHTRDGHTDSEINEGLRPKIHRHFADRDTRVGDPDTFTAWIYEHVFLMPLSDPWLGLRPDPRLAALN